MDGGQAGSSVPRYGPTSCEGGTVEVGVRRWEIDRGQASKRVQFCWRTSLVWRWNCGDGGVKVGVDQGKTSNSVRGAVEVEARFSMAGRLRKLN